jgi:hypothetical protein
MLAGNCVGNTFEAKQTEFTTMQLKIKYSNFGERAKSYNLRRTG